MPLGKILTPEEAAARGVPSTTIAISFPPARPSPPSQKSSSGPSASGSKTSPGTVSTQASSEAKAAPNPLDLERLFGRTPTDIEKDMIDKMY